jgi:hypothetical protein
VEQLDEALRYKPEGRGFLKDGIPVPQHAAV